MTILNFGKHSGKSVGEIEESYLRWGAEKLTNEWKDIFKNELFQRSAKKAMGTHSHALAKLVDRTYDPLIFGKDPTEFITNVSFKDNKIYKYLSTGTVLVEDYEPWYLNVYKEGDRLKGSQFYNYINHIDGGLYEHFSQSWDKGKWFPRSIEEGYMILNGTTLFKNMKVSDASLHSFDIETIGVDPNHKNAKVLLISNTIRKNGETTRRLFDIKDYSNDIEMIQDWCVFVQKSDCDVLIGHNVFSFDLKYLASRCELNLGKDGSSVIFEEKLSKFRKDGSQAYEYNNVKIHGRTVIDTFFLSIKYDIARYFPSYGLKAIEKYLKLVDESRIEWDFEVHPPSRIYENEEMWDKFKEYCKQDSDSPIKLLDIMIPSFFYMNQSVPKTFQQMINEATGSQLDSIMIRSYLQNGNSIPKSSPKVEFEGAISMGIPGVYKNVRKVDVISEYPSIMLQYEIYDNSKDPNKHLLKILEYFREERVKNKKLFKETKEQYYDDLQGSQKIAINSMYGFLGAGYLLFNYPEGAALVTKYGREVVETAIKWATGFKIKKDIKKVTNKGKENEENEYHWVLDEKINKGKGYQLTNCDTDSISYTNGIEPTKEEFIKEIQELNSLFPELIRFEDDGVYETMIVSKAKNYIMKKGSDIKIKGSSFKSSNKEPILRQMNDEFISEMLENNNLDIIKAIYRKYVEFSKNITNINQWVVKKTYTETMEQSERPNETKVMDAVKEGFEKGVLKSVQQGDKLYLYQTVSGMKQKIEKGEPKFYKRDNKKTGVKAGEPVMIPNKILRLSALFSNDADTEHYAQRIEDTLTILENVLPVKEIINGT